MRGKKAIFNIVTNLLLQFLIIIYGFIVPKIIISCYGSDVNGLLSSITQFLSYIVLLDSGFTAVIKARLYKPIASNNVNEVNKILKAAEKLFKTIAMLFLIYVVILVLTYPYIVIDKFDYIYTMVLILIISVSSFSEYYFGMVYKVYLQAKQESYVISLIQMVTYLLNIIAIIFVSRLGVSVFVVKALSGLIFILRPLIQNLYVRKKYNINFKGNTEKYSIPNKWDGFAQHIAAVIHANTDVTLLTFFCKISEVSVYSVYMLVVKGIKVLIQSLTSGIDSLFGDMLAKGESNNLNEKFNIYEVVYLSITTIAFSSTLVLIVPFIKVYTSGITDASYIRNVFAFLLVMSEYIWAIRLPYNSLTLAAGHFKQTRKGAWLECIINVLISLLLVFRYGIEGITIGTIIAMLIRTGEFVYYANKQILKRSLYDSLKKIMLVVVETTFILAISDKITIFNYENYVMWGLNALIVGIISTVIVLILNYVFFKNEINYIIKRLLKRRKK